MNARRRTATVAAWTTAGVLGVAGLSQALSTHADAGSSATGAVTTAAQAPTAKAAARHHARARVLGPLRRGIHGEVVVREGKTGFQTVDAQRGTVSAVTPTSVTVTSADHFVATYGVTSATKVRSGGKPSTLSAVTVGEHVAVVAVKAPSGADTARVVIARQAKTG